MVGQSLDLFWTHDVSEPLLLEYVQMVDASKFSSTHVSHLAPKINSSSPVRNR